MNEKHEFVTVKEFAKNNNYETTQAVIHGIKNGKFEGFKKNGKWYVADPNGNATENRRVAYNKEKLDILLQNKTVKDDVVKFSKHKKIENDNDIMMDDKDLDLSPENILKIIKIGVVRHAHKCPRYASIGMDIVKHTVPEYRDKTSSKSHFQDYAKMMDEKFFKSTEVNKKKANSVKLEELEPPKKMEDIEW